MPLMGGFLCGLGFILSSRLFPWPQLMITVAANGVLQVRCLYEHAISNLPSFLKLSRKVVAVGGTDLIFLGPMDIRRYL
jgi:hypothetical protein